jgi:sarcosine oxidase subunit beta
MKMNRDVVVVGGGYFGCAAACYLSKSGLKTLLLERREIGAGSSGSNFGNVQVQDSEPGLSQRLTMDGYQKIRGLERELRCTLDYRDIGSLVLAGSEAELEALRSMAAEKEKLGLKLDIFGRSELKRAEPNLRTDELSGASYCLQGSLNGFKLMYAFLRRGTEAGLEVRENCPVSGLMMENGRCAGVRLATGETIAAGQVVLAAGAWTKLLCRQAGLEAPVEFVKAEAFVTEAVAPFLSHYISMASFFSEAHGNTGASTSFCCSQRPAGNILLGETSKPGVSDPEQSSDLSSREHCGGICRAVNRYLPALGQVNIIRSWVTCSPYTGSLLPVFGPSCVDGLFLAAGFKSSVVLSAIVGEITAEILNGRDPGYELQEFAGQARKTCTL